MGIPDLSPEESALALYDGLVERYQNERVTLKDALPAIAALILAERFNTARAQRERAIMAIMLAGVSSRLVAEAILDACAMQDD